MIEWLTADIPGYDDQLEDSSTNVVFSSLGRKNEMSPLSVVQETLEGTKQGEFKISRTTYHGVNGPIFHGIDDLQDLLNRCVFKVKSVSDPFVGYLSIDYVKACLNTMAG